jgi:hypothetical protein
MKSLFAFILLLFNISTYAQNLSPEEQQQLLNENKMLKAQLDEQGGGLHSISPEQKEMIMKKLYQGQKMREEHNSYLEELEKVP